MVMAWLTSSMHPTYAVTPEREPLGLVNAWNWAREPRPEEGGARPGVNESVRWVESYGHLVGLAPELTTSASRDEAAVTWRCSWVRWPFRRSLPFAAYQVPLRRG